MLGNDPACSCVTHCCFADVEVVAAPHPSPSAKPWTAAIPEILQPYAYVRLAQVLLTLLAFAGSALNGITLSRGQPIPGVILAIGLLHVGALEVCTVSLLVFTCLPRLMYRHFGLTERPHLPGRFLDGSTTARVRMHAFDQILAALLQGLDLRQEFMIGTYG